MNDPFNLKLTHLRVLRSMRALWIVLLLLLAPTAVLHAQFNYVINNGAITITGLDHRNHPLPSYPVDMTIPSTIDGLPVTSIGDWAFWDMVLTPPPYGNIIYLRDVTIPDSVTKIGNSVFYESVFLDAVTIGNGITRIGDEAFYGCARLSQVVFGGNAPSLGTNVFAEDNATVYYMPGTTGWGLTFGGLPTVLWGLFNHTTNNGAITITKYFGPGGAVTIPDTINGLPVTSVEDGAFSYCTSLTSVTLGNNVTSIGAYAFSDCTSLTSVTIPNSVFSIPSGAFNDCTSLTNVIFGDSVTNIAGSAFSFCRSLTRVAIPSRVARVGDSAFYACWGLTNVTIGSNVWSIGDAAFKCCGLTSVTIPRNVTHVGRGAFSYCGGLGAIPVDALNPAYKSVAGVLFNQNQNTLLQYPAGKAGGYAVPDAVTSIGDEAFGGCAGLSNITIPNSVTNIGDEAFGNCTALTNIAIPNSVTSVGGEAPMECSGLTSITMGDSITRIGFFWFEGCANLTSFAIPHGVTSIGNGAFCGSGLTNVTIPDSVTEIGYDAFDGCGGLTTVTIPASVTSIGDSAFYCDPSLRGVYFGGNAPGLGGSSVFTGDTSATIYYLPGTTGWGATFGGRPTALWFLPNPLILSSGPGFGVQTNAFGFIISWATNLPVVVEACTNPANHSWSPVETNALTSGWSYFSDPQRTNYPARFYRIRSP